MVTVWGTGFRDLGHGSHEDVPTFAGLHCKFGGLDLVPATLDGPGGGDGGEGPQQLRCRSPILPQSDRCETLAVQITNNANNPPGGYALTTDDVGFSYYDSLDAVEVSDTPAPLKA